MTEPHGPLRVARVRSSWTRQDGTVGEHESVLLRQAWRDGKKVRRRTVASLTGLPAAEIDALEAVLNKGMEPVAKGTGSQGIGVDLGQGLEHGSVAAVLAVAEQIGLADMIGPPCRQRDLIMGLIVARLCHPASKVAQAGWWSETTLGEDYGLADAGRNEPFRAMDWLLERKGPLEAALADRFLKDGATNPAHLVLYDLTSTWMEGTKCPLTSFGYSRDAKRGLPQIEFAIIAAPNGIPIGVRLFKGNTSDPTACKDAIVAIRDQFAMEEAVLVGDRGMVTGTRIADLKKHQGLGWIGALRHGPIRELAADQGPLQLTLFDETDLFSFTDPAYPGEVLVACRNPFTAKQQTNTRQALVQATLTKLDAVAARVINGSLTSVKAIEREVGKVIDKHKVARLINVYVEKGKISYGPNRPAMKDEQAFDGVYVIRTSLAKEKMAPEEVVRAYKTLSAVERDFGWIKSTDIAVRPVRHWDAGRVEAHLMICQLAALLQWHLRRTLAPLTFHDELPPTPTTPSKPAKRSRAADAKAVRRTDADGAPLRSFSELMKHLGKLTRHVIRVRTSAGVTEVVEIATPTPTQTRAFDLLGVPIPQKLRG